MEIEIKDVTYKNVLKNINLVFKENEITSIIGKNNSGKTTLFNLIYGSISPDKGKIEISSKSENDNYSQNRDIFYLTENYKDELFSINILEDIKYRNKKIDFEKLYNLLKLFNLNSQILNKNYMEISNGEKKKILLIISILSENKVLLLDMPTSGLDHKGVQALIRLLKREKRAGKVIIVIDENSDFLLSISDKIVTIDNKKIIDVNNRFTVLENENLLRKIGLQIPNICNFRNRVLELKKVKLEYRDNINDLLKDIYRHAK